MEKKLDETPPELNTLFRKLFTQMSAEDAPKAVCLMQWILFAEERLKMSDLHCVLGFRSEHPYPSIKSWEDSDEFLPPSRQREMIINLSRGLVEPVISHSQSATSESATSGPSAPSTPQPNENAEDPTFQFIHESVRDFFLRVTLTLTGCGLGRLGYLGEAGWPWLSFNGLVTLRIDKEWE